jgi:hypothetical protein
MPRLLWYLVSFLILCTWEQIMEINRERRTLKFTLVCWSNTAKYCTGKNQRGHKRRGWRTYTCTQLWTGIARGINCAANATRGPTREGGGLTRVILNALPTTTVHRLTPGLSFLSYVALSGQVSQSGIGVHAGGHKQGQQWQRIRIILPFHLTIEEILWRH